MVVSHCDENFSKKYVKQRKSQNEGHIKKLNKFIGPEYILLFYIAVSYTPGKIGNKT